MVKNPPASAGDARGLGSIPGLGGSPGGGHGKMLQRSLLGYSPWGCKDRLQLSIHAHTQERGDDCSPKTLPEGPKNNGRGWVFSNGLDHRI